MAINRKGLSIIIPTFNEALNLPLLLSDLKTCDREIEIIISDSRSTDQTELISKLYGTTFINNEERNRGLQLGEGAKISTGQWLLFIHADSRLNKDWFKRVQEIIDKDYSKECIYYFNFKVEGFGLLMRLMELYVFIRSKYLKTPYGDQGLLINNKTYMKNKGFNQMEIMEDLDFIQRLSNKVSIRSLKIPIYINGRKWKGENMIHKSFENYFLRRAWKRGKEPKFIYKKYYKKDPEIDDKT
tara:strand:+ start:668 stop:1393 length:726 start_codon:yes stop_codon:yes gene_type:complete